MDPLQASVLPLLIILFIFIRRLRRFPLPPGPPGLPVVGNLFDVGTREEWVIYKAMSEKYKSDLVSFNMLGTIVVVVNSLEAAQELFEKRSALYSDRPRFTMLTELVGMPFHFGSMKYGDWWREHRKLFKKEFQPPATELYKPSILSASRTLLQKLLKSADFDVHLRHMNGTIVLQAGYGIDDQPNNDPYVDIGEKSLQAMAAAGNSTQFLVDQVPVLKYLPGWFPGCGFQESAKDWRRVVSALPRAPMQHVLNAMAEGIAKPCVATKVLSALETEGKPDLNQEKILSNVLGSMYAAIESFILAMVQNPEIMKRGQIAVDKIIGNERLPDFTNRRSIPYVDAILKETLRWNPVTPPGVPHSVVAHDEYMGYHIPAGATVVGNSWAILRNESLYGADTHLFNPDRFMNEDGTLNVNMRHPIEAFGFGRRQCPAIDIAESTIWIAIASLLASFDIVKYVDRDGVVTEPPGEYSSGMLCYPLPFKCTFRPRSSRVESLIRAIKLPKTDVLSPWVEWAPCLHLPMMEHH